MTFSALFLLLTLPVSLLIAAGVLGTSSLPVFYRGERVGRGGRVFRMIKFIHRSCLGLQVFLQSQRLPKSSAVLFTFIYYRLATYRILFQPGPALAYLPVCR